MSLFALPFQLTVTSGQTLDVEFVTSSGIIVDSGGTVYVHNGGTLIDAVDSGTIYVYGTLFFGPGTT